MPEREIELGRGPGPDGGYWIIGLGSHYLGEGLKFTRFLSEARKFLTLEDAELFAFDGRRKMGSTFFQSAGNGATGVKMYCSMSDNIRHHLHVKCTSVMDNTSLLKLSLQKFG